ncbi:MAG: hypothetical protein V1816_11420 [Pseudomonadota bacterium]
MTTLGPGAEFWGKVDGNFGFRVMAEGVPKTSFQEYTVSDIDYKTKLDMFSAGALLDWYPVTDVGFRVSGGVFYNNMNVDIKSTPEYGKSIKINGTHYYGWEVGTLDGTVKYNSLAPFLGLGYLGRITDNWRWHVDGGAAYLGRPKANLSVKGGASPRTAGLIANVNKEEDRIEDEGARYSFYPVFSVGISYAF